jgi:hypothetical protein
VVLKAENRAQAREAMHADVASGRIVKTRSWNFCPRPLPLSEGVDISARVGRSWQVTCDFGNFQGVLQLKRDANKLAGDWAGLLGKARPVTGTWRNGYIELSFDAELGNRPIR